MKHPVRSRRLPRSMSIIRSTITALSFFLFAPAICHSEEDATSGTKPYLLFEGTSSSDGRYAVAWGLPKDPELWTKVCEFERQHPHDTELNEEGLKQLNELLDTVAEEEDLENYIVDVRDGKIIHKLDSSYYSIAGRRPSHHDLEVVWSHAGDLVLVNHTYRYDCLAFCALMVRDGKVGPSLDLNKKLGDAVRIFVAKSFPRGAGYSKEALDVSFSDIKQLSGSKFTAHAESVIGKEWSGDGTTVNFTVIASTERRTLKVADIRVLWENR